MAFQKKLYQLNPKKESKKVVIQQTKRKKCTASISMQSNERGVREILANKLSGTHMGIWLLVPEYLRLGAWVDELLLKIVMEIITEYKKITAAIEASAVKQEKFHEKMKMSFLEKTNELKKSINYARTINFYIALFSMSAIILFVILYLIKML